MDMGKAFKEACALNTAAKALGLGLAGMTQDRWRALSSREREELQDLSCLSPQLLHYEGDRVEVESDYGKRRFWVSRSSGWQPCHIELKMQTSHWGSSADRTYKSVKLITSRTKRKGWRT